LPVKATAFAQCYGDVPSHRTKMMLFPEWMMKGAEGSKGGFNSQDYVVFTYPSLILTAVKLHEEVDPGAQCVVYTRLYI
jgi:hypothetical protein